MKILITSFFIVSLFLAQPAWANITPNDSYYGNQWYLAKIKADDAWGKISASPDVIIAVIDSGIQIDHPDLRNNIWRNQREIPKNGRDDDGNGFIDDINGWDFVTNVPDPNPKFNVDWTEAGISHGTIVAGIISAQGNNREGVAGVTWQAQIMPLKAINDQGEGKISDVIRAIDYAINNGADIINLSFVSFNYSNSLQEALKRAHRAGIIIVAAAGNEQSGGNGYDTDETPIYPACYDGELIGENIVIGVAATDALDQKAQFSSYGSRCVDLTAPGISFFSTVAASSSSAVLNKLYDGYWSGTSMAAPLVSGTLALISQANPALSQREIVNILFASTDNVSRLNPKYSGQLGNGRLNVDRAVEMAKEKLYSRLGRLLILPVTGAKDFKLTTASGAVLQNLAMAEIKSGFNIAAGDVNNDGEEEIVAASKSGFEPRVYIFNTRGKLLKNFLAFDKSFRGGVNLAVADLDDNGQAEIIVTQASGGNGEIKILDFDGRVIRQFLSSGRNFRGGLNIAAGNVDGRGDKEIIIAYAAGLEPQIRIFTSSGTLTSIFLAYEKNFRGGVEVTVANLDGRRGHGLAEIIVAPGKGREPLIKIFDNRAQLKKQFLAYGRNWQGGMDLAAGDINNDGSAEIVLGAQPGAAPHVRIFDGRGLLLESFYAWEESFNGGVNLGIINMNN